MIGYLYCKYLVKISISYQIDLLIHTAPDIPSILIVLDTIIMMFDRWGYCDKLNMQKYDILGLIGEGAYGVVLKCRCN
jgi:hypothetical protein